MPDLQRFVEAQDVGGSYDSALAELRAGHKRSHWMWYVFPQIAGLGRSAMAQRYAIADLAEATAYLSHPVLGPRLTDCVRVLLDQPDADPQDVLGGIDATKLRSSLTMFERASDEPLFGQLLDAWYAARRDPQTLARLGWGEV